MADMGVGFCTLIMRDIKKVVSEHRRGAGGILH